MQIDFEPAADGVYVVTLNRPERMNALGSIGKRRLAQIWQEAENNAAVRAIVVHGAGPRAFCAGSDIKEIQESGEMVTAQVLADAIPSIGVRLTKPVIAALHGYTIGMGLTLAIHCDVRIAAPNSTLGFPEVQYGMLSGISAVNLPAIIGEAAALDLMLSARLIDAQEALTLGLVHQIHDDPYSVALELAKRMAGHSTAAMRLTKELVLCERARRVEAHFALVDSARKRVTDSEEYGDIVAHKPGAGRVRES
ncbi:enoyl-CoA hydratase/isomerase family protein [Burkholderia stagnalis]|uniref:enoyl-CoA hydratase/isomerase family protein n=1 Tax=Burkholderia stagnalis TaxID=1503054 RepID=UPI0007C7874D|nr:enoyl-CoA hydratase/isomerase family protein [Burkholderia stagnalis]